MELPLFEHVGELTRSLAAPDLGRLSFRAHRRGIKLWFDESTPPRWHFEAQFVPRRHVDGTEGSALEIGFHAEHGDVTRNDEILAAVLDAEPAWRPELGDAPEAGPFLGRAEDWRRCSETWIEPDLDDPDLPFEIASRLADYASALQPLVREATAGS